MIRVVEECRWLRLVRIRGTRGRNCLLTTAKELDWKLLSGHAYGFYRNIEGTNESARKWVGFERTDKWCEKTTT